MSMRFSYEFKTSTPVGFARCDLCDVVPSEYRDISVVERVTNKLRKFFTDKRMADQFVEVSVRTDNGIYKLIARIWSNWDNSFDLIYWEGLKADLTEKKAKLTAKDIKSFYLYCADIAISVEEEEKKIAQETAV